MKRAVLKLEHVSRSFLNVAALSDITIEFFPGEVHALIGSNGAGKSTLVRVAAGMIPPAKGKIYCGGREVQWKSPYESQKMGIAVCGQELQIFEELTVLENLLIGNAVLEKQRPCGKEKQRIGRDVLEKVGLSLPLSKKVKDLSLAEKYLIQFGRVLILRPKLLILDELTDVLTLCECDRIYELIEELKADQTSVIFITHKIEEAIRVSDMITILRDGKIVKQVSSKEAQNDDLELGILGQDKKNNFPKLTTKKGEVLLEVNHISNRFLDDISFYLCAGEILGVAGLVGSGRTSLLRAIVGLDEVDCGEVLISSKKAKKNRKGVHEGVGFMPENRDSHGLFSDMTIAQNITIKNLKRIKKHGILNQHLELLESRDAMDRLGLKWKNLNKNISFLSGGNKQKILVARNLFSKCNIYVFDEPTKGVDTAGKVEIYNILNELARRGAGIILVSSDFSELAGMSDRILAIKKGKLSVELTQEETTQLRLYTIFKAD